MAVSIYISTNSASVFPFLHTFSRFIVCRLSDHGHSDWSEVISHCNFDLHFSKINPGIYLEGMMLKLKLQYFGHLMQRVDSLEKTDAGGLGAGGEGDNRG